MFFWIFGFIFLVALTKGWITPGTLFLFAAVLVMAMVSSFAGCAVVLNSIDFTHKTPVNTHGVPVQEEHCPAPRVDCDH